MKPVRNTIGLAADITGILAFVGLSATGIVAWLETRSTFSWTLVIILFAVCFVLPVTAFLILKRLAPQSVERVFSKKSAADKPLELTTYDLRQFLPDDAVLRQLHTILLGHARNWDKDGVILESYLSVTLVHNDYLLRLGLRAQSVWKKREGEFSILADEKKQSQVQEHFKQLKRTPKLGTAGLTEPFYKAFPAWREEVIRRYGPIEHLAKRHLYINASAVVGKPGLQVAVYDDSKEMPTTPA